MILVFGGTTEGRKAAEVLEEAGNGYYYSTKTGEQDIVLHHGQRIDGAMDAAAMMAFCQEHDIRLIVDAAHPFASQLHETIMLVADKLHIPVIRYERIYPPRDASLTWIDDYSQVPTDIHTLLATTGVQSISKLKPLEALGIKVYYRILKRESSIASALKQGANEEQLCYYDNPNDIPVDAEAILLKESGISGGFPEKVEAAKRRGMRIIALKRPEITENHGERSLDSDGVNHGDLIHVNGPYGLRRAVEKLLPEFYPLHSGLTTGTCATAAAVAATLALKAQANSQNSKLKTQNSLPDEVPVILPNGETISVPVGYGDDYAYCIKEAGDDPDVTNGIEIRVSITPTHSPKGEGTIEIVGGEGVGRFTLPGFDYPPGEAAINKGPREMIRQNLKEIYELSSLPSLGEGLRVCLSVPQGKEIAQRTFNPRLGIEGGISIIGVSGIVKPFSEEAFIGSIRKCMAVAQASGAERVVINSGGKSERFVKAAINREQSESPYPTLPQQAFVEYGNYIGETLKIAHELGIKKVTLGVMLGKAVKLAAGHLDTHSRKATMDKDFIRQMLDEAGCDIDISDITLARELWEKLPSDKLQAFASTIIGHCAEHCNPLLPNGTLTILLIDEEGKVYGN